MNRKPPPLPDLDDEEFARRLQPLATAFLPKVVRSDDPRHVGLPDQRIGEGTDSHIKGAPESLVAGTPEGRKSTEPECRSSGIPDSPPSQEPSVRDNDSEDVRTENPDERKPGRVVAAQRLAQIERVRGPKRRFEYFIPARVGDALAEDAARQGKSATLRLLEVLQNAGYPVLPEDLIDLRKERRR